jgi:hypothetical protein
MAAAGAGRVEFAVYLDAEIEKAVLAVQRTCDKEMAKWRELPPE